MTLGFEILCGSNLFKVAAMMEKNKIKLQLPNTREIF